MILVGLSCVDGFKFPFVAFLCILFNPTQSNEGRQAKNGGVKGRDGSAEELDRETGEEQITVGWTRRKDGG